MSEGDEPLPVNWEELVPLLVHPLRVAVIEALRHIDEPLSAPDLPRSASTPSPAGNDRWAVLGSNQ
jgi:hypothetical protein